MGQHSAVHMQPKRSASRAARRHEKPGTEGRQQQAQQQAAQQAHMWPSLERNSTASLTWFMLNWPARRWATCRGVGRHRSGRMEGQQRHRTWRDRAAECGGSGAARWQARRVWGAGREAAQRATHVADVGARLAAALDLLHGLQHSVGAGRHAGVGVVAACGTGRARQAGSACTACGQQARWGALCCSEQQQACVHPLAVPCGRQSAAQCCCGCCSWCHCLAESPPAAGAAAGAAKPPAGAPP